MGHIQPAARFCTVLLDTAMFISLHLVYGSFALHWQSRMAGLQSINYYIEKVCWPVTCIDLCPGPINVELQGSDSVFSSPCTLAYYMSSSSFISLNVIYLPINPNYASLGQTSSLSDNSHIQLPMLYTHLEV